MRNIEGVYQSLNKVLPLDKDEFLAKTSKKDDQNEEVAKHLNSKTATKIKILSTKFG